MKKGHKFIPAHGTFLGLYGQRYTEINRFGKILNSLIEAESDGSFGVEIWYSPREAQYALQIIAFVEPPTHLRDILTRSEYKTSIGLLSEENPELPKIIRDIMARFWMNLRHTIDMTQRISVESLA